MNGESVELESEFSGQLRRRRFFGRERGGAAGRGFGRFGRRVGGSVIVEFRGSKFALGYGVSQKIMVAEE